jgi:hypothetical protein
LSDVTSSTGTPATSLTMTARPLRMSWLMIPFRVLGVNAVVGAVVVRSCV